MKKVLNVGGNTKAIPIPAVYSGWDHILLDIVEGDGVDLVMDARDLEVEDEFDAIYLSHTLEHFPSKDIPVVLSNFNKALKIQGHVHIIVPDFGFVVKAMAEEGMDLEQPLYNTRSGPVTAQDIIFGSPRGVSREEEDFHLHRTGFTKDSLRRALEVAGFDNITVEEDNFQLVALGWKEQADNNLRRVMVTPAAGEKNTVLIGYAHNGSIRNEFHNTVSAAQAYDFNSGKHIIGVTSAGGPYIAQNRNLICTQMLSTEAEWLWQLDTDVVFPSDLLERMLEVADSNERPILGAVYFTPIVDKWMPVWLEEHEELGDVPVQSLTIGEVRELSVVGMGCTLIHRSVLEKMEEDFKEDPWHWFGHDIIRGERAGEDVTFCHRARKSGFLTHGFGYPIVHMKTYPVDWKTFNDQFRLLDLDLQ